VGRNTAWCSGLIAKAIRLDASRQSSIPQIPPCLGDPAGAFLERNFSK
jgi:hypothetical protein